MSNWNDRRSSLRLAPSWVAALLLGAVLAAGASSVGSLLAPPTPVGTIDWLAATENLDEWRQMEQRIAERRSEHEQRLAALQNEIETLQGEIEVLPEGSDERRRQNREVARLSIRLQAEDRYAQQDLERMQTALQLELYQKIDAAVTRIAERDGYWIVLWDDSQVKRVDPRQLSQSIELISRRQVFYTSDEKVDITDEVVDLMNNEFRRGGGD